MAERTERQISHTARLESPCARIEHCERGCVLRDGFCSAARIANDTKRPLLPTHDGEIAARSGLQEQHGFFSRSEARHARYMRRERPDCSSEQANGELRRNLRLRGELPGVQHVE